MLPEPEANAIAFVAELSGLDPEEELLELRMQQAYAFVNLEEPLLQGEIQAFVRQGAALVLRRNSAFDWSLETRGAHRVRLEWRVEKSHRDAIGPHSADAFEHPYLAEEHGLISMPASFLLGPLVRAENTRMRVELPEGWALHSPWIELGEGSYRPAEEASLQADFFAIGSAPGLRDFEALLRVHPGAPGASELMHILRSSGVPDFVALFEAQGVLLTRREVAPSMDLCANLEGTTLKDLDPAGLAWRHGLRAGDTILSVGGRPVAAAGELRAAWRAPGERVTASFLRAGERFSIDAPLEKAVLYSLGDSPWDQ